MGAGFPLEGGISEGVLVDDFVVEVHVNHVASRHHVVVIAYLDERLHFRSLRDLLLAHLRRHLARVAIDADHERMAVRLFAGALVVVFHNDRFSTGIASAENDDNSALLQESHGVL